MDDTHILEVVKPAQNYDLVTLADVRDELTAPRSADARLKRYITSASAVISTYTRRVWREETVKETFYASFFTGTGWGTGFGGGWGYGWRWQPYRRSDGRPTPLLLTRYPVSSITSVFVGDDTEALDPVNYLLDEEKGLLYHFDGERIVPRTWGTDTVVITYAAGYALADVPPDVQQAAMALIRVRYFSHNRDPYLRSINVPGVQEESYWAGPDQSALPPEAFGLLEKHIDMRM
jgi:hypothetical protein